MDRPEKKLEKIKKNKKNKKTVFLEAVYRLKNTSDCIKIDPPGPGRNLKKKSKKKCPKFWTIFSTFLTFFQTSSRTWGINFDTIACVFEPGYGPKKHFFFDRKLFFQNDLGIKNFIANRPSLIRKKYSRRPKPSYLKILF